MLRHAGLPILCAMGILSSTGCDDPGHGDVIVVPAATYTFELSVRNDDPVIREVWLRSEVVPGVWDWFLLDVLDGYGWGTWLYDAAPGVYHEIVVADAYGYETDWAPLGALVQPSVYPYFYGFVVVNGRLL